MADEATTRKIGAGAAMAAVRQGAKELGTALKAFPDSISVDEPGTVFHPTHGEIADQNRGSSIWDRVQEATDRAALAEEPTKDIERE